MAHVQKIKQGAVAPLVAHYERVAELERGFTRGNIDPERTALNYNLRQNDVRQEVRLAIAQHEETSGKGIRKDANVLCDWVVTLPQDCPRDRSRDFFESVAQFMEGRYGKGNVLGCYVHMDETTPHAHIPILPMRDGKLVASKVVNRADLKSFHGDLGKAVDEALGMHVSIELSEEQNLNKVLHDADSQEQFQKAKDAARAEIDGEIRDAEQRLECLRREVEKKELEPPAESLAQSARTLYKARGEGNRERELEGEESGLRSGIGELERQVQEARSRAGQLERDIERLGMGVRDAGRRRDGARARVEQLIERLGWVPDHISDLAQDIGRKLGMRVMDSFTAMTQRAREAADAWNAARVARGEIPRVPRNRRPSL